MIFLCPVFFFAGMSDKIGKEMEQIRVVMDMGRDDNFYQDTQVLLESVMQELMLRVDLLREKKGFPITPESALTKVYDAVGIRIVCQFVDDVYQMVDILKRQEDIEIIKEKDAGTSQKTALESMLRKL